MKLYVKCDIRKVKIGCEFASFTKRYLKSPGVILYLFF